MVDNKKISLVIPCHNEEEGIEQILRDKPEFIDEVIVVDNNSTDRTADVARRFGANVIAEERKGYGFAYLAGFRNVSGDIIVTMDGDNTYSIGEVAKLLEALSGENLDFVSGCRFPLRQRRSMEAINIIGNIILTIFFKLLVFKNIRDSQSGMWAFKKSILAKMNLRSGGMALSEEIKMEAILNKDIKFSEVRINYFARVGKVKLKRWKDGLGNLAFLFRKRLEIFLKIKSEA